MSHTAQSSKYDSDKRLVICNCPRCKGALVPAWTYRRHQKPGRVEPTTRRKVPLRKLTVSELNRKRKHPEESQSQDVLPGTPQDAGTEPVLALNASALPSSSHDGVNSTPVPPTLTPESGASPSCDEEDPSDALSRVEPLLDALDAIDITHNGTPPPAFTASLELDHAEADQTTLNTNTGGPLPTPDAAPFEQCYDPNGESFPSPGIIVEAHTDLDAVPVHQDEGTAANRPIQGGRFHAQGGGISSRHAVESSSTTWFWRPVMLLAAWLHIKDGLSHRGVSLLLNILRLIFLALGVLSIKDDSPTDLRTAFKRLNLEDNFLIVPMCPFCHHVFVTDVPASRKCTTCRTPLFKDTTETETPNTTFSAWFTGTTPPASSKRGEGKPKLQVPMRLPRDLIADLINSSPDMEAALDQWRTIPRQAGKLTRVQDGRLWSELPAPGGGTFFDNSPERPHADELRIGVTLGEDGFSFSRSAFSAKHSTGALSLNVANLDTHLRYRPENLLVCGLSPGPHELNADDMQRFMAAFVTDFIALYDEGLLVKTISCPEGRRVRLILIAVCCDHPALCRVGGFADHRSKRYFCPKCGIFHDALFKEVGLCIDAFPARDSTAHRRLAHQYSQLQSKEERDAFCALHGLRWSELLRLPYFNPVRMVIIDPMHNILLGVMKVQWYEAWIKGKALRGMTATRERELDAVHEYLRRFEMPEWVGRLPRDVGYPAGGSLTSDEWKAMLLVYAPVVIPMIWQEWADAAERKYQDELSAWHKHEAKRAKQEANPKAGAKKLKARVQPQRRMHANDADNFLKLAAAMKILLARSIDEADLPRAKQLLGDYLRGFSELHPRLVKPNHHYITHIFDQILDYGPVYGFWTYLFERLNKILKSYSVNNRDGGELEVTFYREFSREVRLRTTLANLAATGTSDTSRRERVVNDVARLMITSGRDDRGTIAALMHSASAEADEMAQRFTLGPGTREYLSLEQQEPLTRFLHETYPTAVICHRTTVNPAADASFLNNQVTIVSHVTMDGRRIVPSRGDGYAPNAIVQIVLNGRRYVGEVALIMIHEQPVKTSAKCIQSHLLGVRWFVRHTEFDASAWDEYPELEIFAWRYDEYLDPDVEGPPFLIPIASVLSQACRVTLATGQKRVEDIESDADDDTNRPTKRARIEPGISNDVWLTVGLTRDVQVL